MRLLDSARDRLGHIAVAAQRLDGVLGFVLAEPGRAQRLLPPEQAAQLFADLDRAARRLERLYDRLSLAVEGSLLHGIDPAGVPVRGYLDPTCLSGEHC